MAIIFLFYLVLLLGMGVLPHEDLLDALGKGEIRLAGHEEPGAFSIDICVGYELIDVKTGKPQLIPEDGLVVSPHNFYLWEFPQDLFLSGRFMGEVRSRSSYARLGVRVDENPTLDQFRGAFGRDRTFRPYCSLSTFGTHVLIRPGEPIAQLVVRTGLRTYPPSAIQRAMDTDALVVMEGEKTLTSSDASFRRGLELHMDDVIYVYDGAVLDPHQKDMSNHFNRVDLSSHAGGYHLPYGSFFISSSVESVATDNASIGFVTEFRDCPPPIFPGGMTASFVPYPFKTHPNAPYHAFGKHALRQITFENYVTDPEGITLQPRDKQAELLVVPLTRPSAFTKPSTYTDQKGATLMRNGSR